MCALAYILKTKLTKLAVDSDNDPIQVQVLGLLLKTMGKLFLTLPEVVIGFLKTSNFLTVQVK